MFSLLAIWTIWGFVVNEQLYGVTINCGIQEHWVAFREEYTVLLSSDVNPVQTAWNLLFIVFDLSVLLLYWYKIMSFRWLAEGDHDAVYNRIQRVLHQVVILTFFYQIA